MTVRDSSRRYSFNSRLREEATRVHLVHGSKNIVSTHASVRRRRECQAKAWETTKFQLTPP